MHLEKNIQRIRQNNNSQVWLGGDFNLGGIGWHNYSIKSKAQNSANNYLIFAKITV
jgi:hypothetical protein